MALVVDTTPAGDGPCRPFSGYVVNVNVTTAAHRDMMDHCLCIVFVLGEHEGGELCLYEPGLVLPLKAGRFTVFPSWRFTHFNLGYTGERSTVVLHSDKRCEKWAKSRNGWLGNAYVV